MDNRGNRGGVADAAISSFAELGLELLIGLAEQIG
jgi:hypothetical protein